MIKINLLSEGKRPAAVRKGKQPSQILQGQNIGVWLLGGGVLVGIVTFALLFGLLSSAIKKKDDEIAAAQKRVDELAEVIKQVEDYKLKKSELERKITVINDLKLSQRGPVRIMDDISRALPELLWLDRMSVADSTIEIEGRAFNDQRRRRLHGQPRQLPRVRGAAAQGPHRADRRDLQIRHQLQLLLRSARRPGGGGHGGRSGGRRADAGSDVRVELPGNGPGKAKEQVPCRQDSKASRGTSA